MLGERHQLPLEGWDQGCLLLKGKGKQVVVMVAKPKKVVLGVVAIKKKLTFHKQSNKTSSGVRFSPYRKLR